MSTVPDFGEYQRPERMAAKASWMPPVKPGARVLDVGCDHGHWSAIALQQGAGSVLGIDRGRDVRGRGFVNLADENHVRVKGAEFNEYEIGKQWPELGEFDLIYVMSVYHHIYEACGGSHLPIWYWLRQQCADNGMVVWESPVDLRDPVAQRHISSQWASNYNNVALQQAMGRYFTVEKSGPAVHEPFR